VTLGDKLSKLRARLVAWGNVGWGGPGSASADHYPRAWMEGTMINKYGVTALAACGAFLASIAHAQIATSLEQAELAMLTPEKRAEVQTRANQPGQTVSEVLQTMLLNGIKNKHKASRIVALDFGRGIAVVELQGGGMTAVNFDTTTLAIK
jgi:hypothetical protein